MSSGLVGRQEELAAIRDLLRHAAAGRPELLLISGEPGIGKTALAEAATDLATRFRTVWGRCWDSADAPAHWLWTQVLRELDRAARRPGTHADGLPPAPADTAAHVASALATAAREQPLLLLLDDLHLGTPGAVQALPLIAERLGSAPVALLATFRSGAARTEGVGEALRALAATHPHRRLAGLDEAGVRALLRRSHASVPARQAERLQAATAGNPLLVTVLAHTRGGEIGEDPLTERPPEVLRAHVRRQMAVLPPATQALLSVVTVLARSTTLVDVAAVAGLDAATVRQRIAPAIADGLLEQEGEHVRLRHDVIRASLYADLPIAERAHLHGAAARALARRGDADARTRAEVAHHHFHGTAGEEDPAALLPDLLRGAADARQAGAVSESAALLGHALACAEDAGMGVGTRVGILLDLGVAQERAGRPAAAERTWQAAMALSRLGDDRELIARTAIDSARSALFLGLAGAVHVRALEEALAALGDEPTPLRARVLALLSIALHRTPERLRSRRLAEEAVEVADAAVDPGAQAVALLAMHEVTRDRDTSRYRPDLAAAAVQAADAAGDDDLSALARSTLVIDHREHGDAQAVAAAIAALRAFCVERRHAIGRWAADVHELVSAILDDDQARRAALTDDLAAATRDIRDLASLTDFAVAMTDLGPLDAAMRKRVRTGARRRPDMLSWRSRMLLDAAERGAPDAADELAAVVAVLGARARTSAHWLLAAALAAEAAAHLGDIRQARALGYLLAPRADTFIVSGRVGASRGSVRYHLGLLALTTGDAPAAVAHLREAARSHARPGFAVHRARTAAALDRAEALARSAIPRALVRDGAEWALRGAERTTRLPDLKGMRYLARLVAQPHQELPALELFRLDAAGGAGAGAAEPALQADAGGADPQLDAEAKRAYRRRLRALASEREAADLLHDRARVARIDEERTALEAALARGVGLGGRDRRLPSEIERTRTSVTKALRTAVERIRDEDPSLAAHLDASLRTGARCAYAPAGPPQLTS